MPYSYTHPTATPSYHSTHHTIERLSRSSWQITSPLLPSPIPAKSYAEAKALASEIDFSALSVKAAEPEPVETVEAMVEAPAVNPFEAILTEAAQIADLGDMQGAYDQAVRECDLCAVLGHISGQSLGDVFRGRFRLAVEAARAKVPDYARVVDLAGLLGVATERTQDGIAAAVAGDMEWAVVCLCDMPDGFIKMALIRWAVTCGSWVRCGSWVSRLRLEGTALRYAREAQEARKVEDKAAQIVKAVRHDQEQAWARALTVQDGGRADMGRDSAREWGYVWSWATGENFSPRLREGKVRDILPSLLSPEPEHWLPVGDGRVLIVNWRAGETTGEPISAAVWLDDGGLSLLGSYVLGSGWVSDDRLGEEDVDSEALGVILEAIASSGLATIA